MLSTLRRNKNSPIVMAVLGVVVLLMIGFGVSFNEARTADYAAKVNGEVITEAEFMASYSNEYQRRQQFQPGYDRTMAERDELRKTVMNRLVTMRILAQRARKMGLQIDDTALAEQIMQNPSFHEASGAFSRNMYERRLNSFGMTDQQFEALERDRLLAEKLMTALQTMGVSDPEVKQAFAFQETKRDIEFVSVSKTAFSADIGTVTSADVDAWREDSEDAEAEVVAFYKKNKATRYDVPRRACTQQILVRMDEATPPKMRTKRRERIKEAGRKLAQGADFAEVAREYSEDQSAARGGEIPCFSQGDGLPEVEEQAFSMEPGEISPVITTGFGLHIIKLNRFEDAIRRKLDEVRPEIERELAAMSRVEFKAKALAQQLIDAASSEVSLQEALEQVESEVELEAETTGPFAVNRTFLPKLGNAPDVAEATWKLEPDAPVCSEPIETDEAYIAIRLISTQAPEPSKLASKRDNLANMLETTKVNDLYEGWQESLRTGAKIEVNPRLLDYGS